MLCPVRHASAKHRGPNLHGDLTSRRYDYCETCLGATSDRQALMRIALQKFDMNKVIEQLATWEFDTLECE